MKRFAVHAAAVLPLLFAPILVGADEAKPKAEINEAYIREHYTKYEHLIPMRDGVRLFTTVYAPKDDAQKWPILLTRTPYSVRPYSVDRYPSPGGLLLNYAREKFIFVLQDVRGRNGSEGDFVHMRPHRPVKTAKVDIDESTDTWDTIDWAVKNIANNNGNVGMTGISYPGFYTAAGMIDSHPALKCASPQAPIADWFVGEYPLIESGNPCDLLDRMDCGDSLRNATKTGQAGLNV